MKYSTSFYYTNKFKHTNTNQHGPTYKVNKVIRLSVVTLTASANEAIDLRNLAVLSDKLDTPLRYNFDAKPQEVCIKLVSLEQLKKADTLD